MKKYFVLVALTVAVLLLPCCAFAEDEISEFFVLTRPGHNVVALLSDQDSIAKSAGTPIGYESYPESETGFLDTQFSQNVRGVSGGESLIIRPYVGTGVFMPKEGNLDIGYSATLGLEITGEKEAVFLDATFSQAGGDDTYLGMTGEVRSASLNLGYKVLYPGSAKWLLGAGLQSQSLDLGYCTLSALTVMALAEYKIDNTSSLRFVTSQVHRKSNFRFGLFELNFIRYF